MKKSSVLQVHMIYWLIYLFFTFTSSVDRIDDSKYGIWPEIAFALGINAAVFYCFYFYSAPSFLSRKGRTPLLKKVFLQGLILSLLSVMLRPLISNDPGLTAIVPVSILNNPVVLIPWTIAYFVSLFQVLAHAYFSLVIRVFISTYGELNSR